MLLNEENIMIKNLEKLNYDKAFENRLIIIFGSNEPAERMIDWLLEHKITPVAMVDNNKKKVGFTYRDIKVHTPEKMLLNYKKDAMILIASKYYEEMCRQLEEMGYTKGKHIIKVVDMNKGNKFSLSNIVFKDRKEYLLRGLESYQSIRSKYDKSYKLFVCPYAGLGDVYEVGRYLEIYCNKENISHYVVTVVGGACRKVVALFDITNMLILTQEENDCLVQTLIFLGLEQCNAMILHQRFPYTTGIGALGNYKDINFDDHFRYTIFGLSEYDYGKKPKKFENEDVIDSFFHKNGLRLGKTVILSPYANTATKLPNEYWEKLAKEYQDNGYVVCTNSSSDNEPAIKGTKKMFFSIEIAVAVVEKAGTFVGLRSGLCDVISSAIAKKIIFYPDRVYLGGKLIDFYSLRKMRLCEDVEEIVVYD